MKKTPENDGTKLKPSKGYHQTRPFLQLKRVSGPQPVALKKPCRPWPFQAQGFPELRDPFSGHLRKPFWNHVFFNIYIYIYITDTKIHTIWPLSGPASHIHIYICIYIYISIKNLVSFQSFWHSPAYKTLVRPGSRVETVPEVSVLPKITLEKLSVKVSGRTILRFGCFIDLGVSKNNGTPKWMVKIMGKPYFLMDDLGVPLFSETPIYEKKRLGSSCPIFSYLTKNQPGLKTDDKERTKIPYIKLEDKKPPKALDWRMWVWAGCWSTARGILETISQFSARPCHIQCLFIGRPQTYCSHMRAWGQGKGSEKITNLLYKFWNPVWFAKAPSPFRTSSKTKETRKAWWQIRPDVCSTFGGKLPYFIFETIRVWGFGSLHSETSQVEPREWGGCVAGVLIHDAKGHSYLSRFLICRKMLICFTVLHTEMKRWAGEKGHFFGENGYIVTD